MSFRKHFDNEARKVRKEPQRFPNEPITKTDMAVTYIIIAIAVAIAVFIMPAFYIL